ncbi:unnamed protein product, partial [Rotaria magnacalcarata]
VQNDNIIPASYFNSAFPGAIGLMFTDESLNGVVIIPKDNIGNFQWTWNYEIVYELIYADPALNLTSSTESKKKTLFNWLGSAGSLLILWFGSMIPSLWCNIYEELVKVLFYDLPTNSSNTLDLKLRIVILSIISCIYMVLMIIFTPLFLKMLFNKLKAWIQEINIEKLTYNALAPVPFVNR